MKLARKREITVKMLNRAIFATVSRQKTPF